MNKMKLYRAFKCAFDERLKFEETPEISEKLHSYVDKNAFMAITFKDIFLERWFVANFEAKSIDLDGIEYKQENFGFSNISIDYLTLAINIIQELDEEYVLIKSQEDYPITLEGNTVGIVIAPKVIASKIPNE